MFKNHPKGLIAASLANMGERFGFYIMMAILTLFISAKFGLSEQTTGYVYSAFYARSTCWLSSVASSLTARRSTRLRSSLVWSSCSRYVLIAIPTPTPVPNLALYLTLTCVGLGVIAFGNGLFKGNLQVLIGQMYDDPRYQSARDAGFQIFYMFINIGGIFAPFMAVGIR